MCTCVAALPRPRLMVTGLLPLPSRRTCETSSFSAPDFCIYQCRGELPTALQIVTAVGRVLPTALRVGTAVGRVLAVPTAVPKALHVGTHSLVGRTYQSNAMPDPLEVPCWYLKLTVWCTIWYGRYGMQSWQCGVPCGEVWYLSTAVWRTGF